MMNENAYEANREEEECELDYKGAYCLLVKQISRQIDAIRCGGMELSMKQVAQSLKWALREAEDRAIEGAERLALLDGEQPDRARRMEVCDSFDLDEVELSVLDLPKEKS